VIDSHAHLEPRMLDVDHALEKMDAAGVDKVALIPALNDLLPSTPEALLSAMRTVMQHRATRPIARVIHRATLRSDGDLHLNGERITIYRRPDNDAVAEVLRAHPERFLGWVFLNPKADPRPLETLERYLEVPGFVGVKLHPHWHDYRTDLLHPILQHAEAKGLPVLIHLGFGKRGDFRVMAARYPKLTIISAHAGFPFYGDLWRYRRAYPNLHVDLSSPYIDEALARKAVAAMGPERCLYGTDAPYGFPEADESYDYTHIRGWIERLPVSTKKREGIFGANFAAMIE